MSMRKRAAGRLLPAGNVALSVRQPWAWAIAAGLKDVENRSWPTSYRGPLLIHASRKPFPGGIAELRRMGIDVPTDELVFGAYVARVQLVDCVTDADSEWAIRGMYHFVLERAHRFAYPVEARGRLGLFDPHKLGRVEKRRMTMHDTEGWARFVRGLGPVSD